MCIRPSTLVFTRGRKALPAREPACLLTAASPSIFALQMPRLKNKSHSGIISRTLYRTACLSFFSLPPESCYVAQASLILEAILLSLPPKCWDNRYSLHIQLPLLLLKTNPTKSNVQTLCYSAGTYLYIRGRWNYKKIMLERWGLSH